VLRYWKRYPTGQEWLVQSIIAINHGAKGVISWNAPTTADIQSAASSLAKASSQLATFIFSHTATFTHISTAGADIGVWADGTAGTLVLATNTAYTSTHVALTRLGVRGTAHTVLANGASVSGANLVLQSVGTGVFVFRG
jgi:fructose-1,6-bisphosphatase/sedoheptulose 1,7-bisphosphatase-like protein